MGNSLVLDKDDDGEEGTPQRRGKPMVINDSSSSMEIRACVHSITHHD